MTHLVATLVMIFAPLGQLARLWRALIAYVDGLNAILTDETLTHELDDPHTRAWAERYIAILVAQRTRELLGLPFQRIETRQPAHLPHPPSRKHLLARHARMLASLSSIERTAQTRAARIRREHSPLRLRTACASTSPMPRMVEDSARVLEVLHHCRRGRWIGASSRRDGGGVHPRAPPVSAQNPLTQTRPALLSHQRGRTRMLSA